MKYPWERLAALMSEPKNRRQRHGSKKPKGHTSLDGLQHKIESMYDEVLRLLANDHKRSSSVAEDRFRRLCTMIEENPGALPWSIRSIHRLRAIGAVLSKKMDAALKLYPQRVPRDISPTRWALERSLIALRLKQPDLVLKDLREAWRRLTSKKGFRLSNDYMMRLCECIGACYWQKGEWQQAVPWWRRAHALGCADVVEPLSYIYFRLGVDAAIARPTEAMRRWKAAQRLGADLAPAKAAANRSAQLHMSEALFCWEEGDRIRAGRHWRKTLEYQPRAAAATLGLAFYHADREEWALTEAFARESVKLQRGAYEPHLALMAALVMQGKYEAAAAEASRLTDLAPGDVEIESLWSLLLLAGGEEPEGVFDHIAQLARDTAHPYAVQAAVLSAQALGRLPDVNDLISPSGWLLSLGSASIIDKNSKEGPATQGARSLLSSLASDLFGADLTRAYPPLNDSRDPGVNYVSPPMPPLRWWLAEGAINAPSPT